MSTFTRFFKSSLFLTFLTLITVSSKAQNIFTEGFEGGTVPPTGWTATSQGSYVWSAGQSGAGYAGGVTVNPHNGAWMAYFHNWLANNYSANLITKPIPLQNYSGGYGRVTFWMYRMQNYGASDNVQVYANGTADLNGTPSLLGQVYVDYSLSGTNAPGVSGAGWYKYSFNIPASYNTANAYVIFKDNSNYEYDTYIDDVSLDYIAPCVAPTSAPTSLTLTSVPNNVFGTVVLSSGSDGVVVVRTPGSTSPGVVPVNTTTYTVGQAFGTGVVVYSGNGTTFTDNTAAASTAYTYTAYSMNSSCTGGPLYYTTPTTSTITSSGNAYPLPFTENFNNGGLPLNWTTAALNSASLTWTYQTSFTSHTVSSAHSLPGMMELNAFGCCSPGNSTPNSTDLRSPLLHFGGSAGSPATIRLTYWMTVDGYSTYAYPLEGISTFVNSTATSVGGTNLNFAPRYISSYANTSTGNWVQVTITFTTTLNDGYLIFRGDSQYGNNFAIDDVNAYVLAPCTTPTATPVGIVLNTSTPGVITGTITAAPSSDAVLVVRTTGTQPVNAIPQNGVNYTVGQTFGAGVVVYSNTNNIGTFSDYSVGSATLYTYTAFSYNSLCTGGPNYYASAYTTTATSAFNPFTRVAVTGFNSDVIANGNGTPVQTTNFTITGTNGFDNGGYAFPAQDYHNGTITPTTGYMPNGGLISSQTTSGLSWQLGDYSGFNCLQLSAATPQSAVSVPVPVTTGTLTFVTPQRSPVVYVLITGGSAGSGISYSATVNFTDGTSQVFNNTVLDWFGNTPIAIAGVGRVKLADGTVDGTAGASGNPRLYQHTLTLNSTNALKFISSITFKNNQTGASNATVGVFGVSIVSPCNGTPTASTISSTAIGSPICAGATATINVTEAASNSTVSGIAYVWQQAPTATGPWSPVVGGSGNGTLSYTTNGLAVTTYFRMVDSCLTTGQVMPTTNVYQVPVTSYSLPYSENFTGTANGAMTTCYTSNVNNTSKWAEYDNFKAPDGTTVPKVLAANDPTNNATGKNEYFTIPALLLQGGIQYRIRFGYARGKDNPGTNSGTAYTENLNLYVSSPIAPGTAGSQPPPNGLSIFNSTINFDNFANANVVYTAPNTNTYFFSWYTNTPHPQAGSGIPGGYVAIDSIKIDSVGCVAPTINFQPLSTVACIGNNASFTVNATAYGIGYQWQVSTNNGNTWSNISDGPVAGVTGSSYIGTLGATLTVQAAGSAMNSYKFRCYITGTCGGTAPPATTNAANLTVSPFPTATITAGGATAICPGSTVALNANTGTGQTYQWQLNGVALVNSSSSTYAAGSAGGYTVTVTNSNGCSTTSNPTIVTLNAAPAITITSSGPTTFCTGNSLTLTANTGVNITYQWLQNNNPYGLPINTLTVNSSGNYTLRETNTANGCTATYPVPINVIVNGPSSATATAAGATTFCLGGSVALNANTGTGYTYQWQVATNGGAPINITSAAGTQPTYSAANSGAYRVVISQNGCSLASNYDTVTVNSPVTTVNLSSPSICGGNSVTMSAVSNPNYTYQWYNGATAITPGGTGSSYVTNSPGSYTVAIHDNSTGCNATSNATVLNTSTPPPAFITAAGPTSFCTGNSVLLYADTAGTATGYNYQWKVDSGYGYVTIPGATTYTITTPSSGNYQVVVSNGCTTTSTPVTVTAIPTPVPAITASRSTNLCPGDIITLSTGSGAGLTYQWSRNSQAITGATTTSYTTDSGGTYSIKVTNNYGCSGTAQSVVTANPYPTAHISTPGSLKICQGDGVYLNADSYTPNNNYKWFLNGIPVASGPSYHTGAAGTYKVLVTSQAGCSAYSQDTTVVVRPLPTATITPAGTTYACAGNNVTLTANGGNGFTYAWSYNNGNTGASGDTYTANAAGNYTVTVTDTNNCHNTSTVTSLVYNPVPTATIASPTADTGICAGNMATLTAATGNNYTYQWQLNGGNINGATAASYATSTSGNYTVVVYQGICSATSAQRTVTVHPMPVSDTIRYVGNRVPSICAGSSVALMAPSAQGYSYQWMLGGGDINGAVSSTYAVSTPGDYSVKVTTGFGCSEVTPALTINSYPVPNPTIIAYNTTLTTGNFVTYQWYYNGVAIPNAINNSIVATANGNYTVSVTDTNGCSQTSAAYNMQDVGVSVVNGKIDVKVYPNPATSTIRIDAPVKVNVTVSGLDGRMLIHKDNVTEVNIDNLANGTYMITVTDEHNTVIKIDKLVKTGM